ncbi:ankyrin repeat protein [Ancylostoma ceylanicum]|uniref:Ankyrin repeat protein n=1 Tax=Ancylostoma ceylanicum TaxID=53326 RepID=A0A0D6L7I8_9BILA|nr:ankyrin repeat protein [Ancylostoma ceylanicum]
MSGNWKCDRTGKAERIGRMTDLQCSSSADSYCSSRNSLIACPITVRQLVKWDKRLMEHKDEKGNTPLHLAAENGHGATIKVLIDAGCDIEAKNSEEDTALFLAVFEGHSDAVEILLKNKALIENKELSLAIEGVFLEHLNPQDRAGI